jgi:hypothetical protein
VQIRKITGSGGGGGGGSAFHEDPNSLQVNQTFRALYALGEGQIGGLVNGPKSIFINGTPLQNSDGTFNFGGKITWDERVGLPSQPYMPGYPAASNIFNVGIQVKAGTPLVQTTSASNIDQMRVTVGLPNGLCEQKTDANALVGGSSSSTALNSYVGTLTVMNSSGQSYIHSNGKAYGDGQWGYILGAEANNSANWLDVQNGTGQIKMHTNGDFLITAGGGAMTLTQNGLTINQVDVIKTANIQGQAVTVPQSAYTAGYATAAGGGVVQTLTVTSSGAPALLIFGTYAYSTHFETLYIQLKRDGNVIFQVGPMGSGYDTAIGGQNMETGTIIDTPTAGTHTYQLYVGDSAGNQVSAQARCITYLEVKR